MSNIGERIKKRRKELGITQEDLSNKLGYRSKTTIAKIENGTNDITAESCDGFCKSITDNSCLFNGICFFRRTKRYFRQITGIN